MDRNCQEGRENWYVFNINIKNYLQNKNMSSTVEFISRWNFVISVMADSTKFQSPIVVMAAVLIL